MHEMALAEGVLQTARRLVRQQHMRAARIGIRINRDRLKAHPPRGADHPASDFAAIGDEDFGEHLSFPTTKGQPGDESPERKRR